MRSRLGYAEGGGTRRTHIHWAHSLARHMSFRTSQLSPPPSAPFTQLRTHVSLGGGVFVGLLVLSYYVRAPPILSPLSYVCAPSIRDYSFAFFPYSLASACSLRIGVACACTLTDRPRCRCVWCVDCIALHTMSSYGCGGVAYAVHCSIWRAYMNG
ncbi:hypothetical protein C8Q77DRAFT_37101 [Trametes polyzona]|nr:hypothetical protein C8Q77DRAFT_37101 [Trametes polyzona]